MKPTLLLHTDPTVLCHRMYLLINFRKSIARETDILVFQLVIVNNKLTIFGEVDSLKLINEYICEIKVYAVARAPVGVC